MCIRDSVIVDLIDLHAKLIRNMRYLEAQGVDLAIGRIKSLHNLKASMELVQLAFDEPCDGKGVIES